MVIMLTASAEEADIIEGLPARRECIPDQTV